jgi:hypothetical protein
MKRPSPAFVLSCIAIVLSFTGGAVAATQITGKQIKNGSITGKDIKDDSLTAQDIKGNIRGPVGPRGPAGPAGSGGGPQGIPPGVSVSYRVNTVTLPADGLQLVAAPCPGDQVAIGGWTRVGTGPLVRFEEAGDQTRDFDSWAALFENPTADPQQVSVYAICIAATNVSGLPPQ